jgi:hypothetical protein
MFHIRDLLTSARLVEWKPRSTDPVRDALSYIRRNHNVDLHGAFALSLPGDVNPSGVMGNALSTALVTYGSERLESLATVLKDPDAVLASVASGGDRARSFWLLGAVREKVDEPARVVVAEVCARPRARKRGAMVLSANLQLFEDSEEPALRRRLEDVYLGCADPLRIVRRRGRCHGPPVAICVGMPEPGLSDDVVRRLPAIAALDGYELRLVNVRATAPGVVQKTVIDARPELVVLWLPYIPSSKVGELVCEAAGDAQIVDLQVEGEDALDEARVWFSAASVKYFDQPEDEDAPADMVAAVEQARDQARYLVYVDQAARRAKSSEYKAPGEVLRGLKELDRLAGIYRAGSFKGSTKKLFLDHSDLIYRDAISLSTRNKWKARYTLTWRNRDHLMGPHNLLRQRLDLRGLRTSLLVGRRRDPHLGGRPRRRAPSRCRRLDSSCIRHENFAAPIARTQARAAQHARRCPLNWPRILSSRPAQRLALAWMVAARLTDYRFDHGLSQRALAKLLGVS